MSTKEIWSFQQWPSLETYPLSLLSSKCHRISPLGGFIDSCTGLTGPAGGCYPPPLAGCGSPQNVIPSEAWFSLEVNPKGFSRTAFAVTKAINAHPILLKRPQNKTISLVHESLPGTLLKSEAASKATILHLSPCRSWHAMGTHPGEGAMSLRNICFIPGNILGRHLIEISQQSYEVILVSPLHKRAKGITQKLTELSKVTQIVNGGATIWTQYCSTAKLCSFSTQHAEWS